MEPRVYRCRDVAYYYYDSDQTVIVVMPGMPPTTRPMTAMEIRHAQQAVAVRTVPARRSSVRWPLLLLDFLVVFAVLALLASALPWPTR